MSIEIVSKILDWPTRKQILNPTGAGAKVYARLVEEKIGQAIRRLPDGQDVQVGVLIPNQESDDTQVPLAIVCEFAKPVSLDTLKTAHKLAWNFCRAPLLVTIEPHLLRTWSCYEPPAAPNELDYGAEISDARFDIPTKSLSQQAANSLHWINLVSGQFFRDNADRFRAEQRADQMLLANLRFIRNELHIQGLGYDAIHDLLARVIFIQFLFHRKDSSGQSALNANFLRKRFEEGVLSKEYEDLGSILSNYDDAYKFFQFLNDKFNGDLFPGKGATSEEREIEWRDEKKQVKAKHLKLLAEFVGGRIEMERGQYCLWDRYSFDAIPLEFISSIYEVFVNKEGSSAHYTPSHIVDFMLDGVLPWDGEEWDLKILDPACGSGIFLVKAFQRLVQRWKNANPSQAVKAAFLKQLLENNLFGIDIDPHAVRVASFSLYLALCDAVDPRHYWQHVKFPRLRERQVIEADFFYEEKPLFALHQDIKEYDLIVGNAPWGHNKLTAAAKLWAKAQGWETVNKDIGPLFLPKAATITKKNGHIVMIQPVGGILSNQFITAQKFRKRLFETYKIEEIVNLSALRFNLFASAISPACIVTMRGTKSDNDAILYVCPKPAHTNEDDYRIIIEPQDINEIYPSDIIADQSIFMTLIWGGKRDLRLLRELQKQLTFEKLLHRRVIKKRRGVNRGDRKKMQPEIIGRSWFDADKFPEGIFLNLNADTLPINQDPFTHSKDSTSLDAFEFPQLLVKQSWQQEIKRFRSVLIQPGGEGILCSRSYISIHTSQENLPILEAACLSYNSKLAVYYLLLSSGRFASYRPEATVEDFMSVPIPPPRQGLLKGIKNFTDIDNRICSELFLKDSERILIEDLYDYTLPDFKGDISSPGRKKTRRLNPLEPDLTLYCESFIKVLNAGFGKDKKLCATIYQDDTNNPLPIRLVAIHFDWDREERIKIEPMESKDLRKNLEQLNEKYLKIPDSEGGIFYRRVARLYDEVKINGHSIPTLYLIKPDQIRYWLRSTAMRDADEIAAEIVFWKNPDLSPNYQGLAA